MSQQHPQVSKSALESLGTHPGWLAFCARMEAVLRNEIEAEIFNPETTDERRRALVLARAVHAGSLAPEKVRLGMIARLNTELAKS